MNRSRLRYILIFALMSAACNARSDESPGATGETQAAPGSAAADPSVIHHPEPPARPQQKTDSLQLEGVWERISAQLVQPTSSIPFSTYVPQDMVFEMAASGEGEGFYFFTNFGGRKNEHAFMLVFLLPAGSTGADATRLGTAFLASRADEGVVTRVQQGNYQNRHFYIAYVYPAEFADGMAPRTHYIRSQWIWLNDGQSLSATL
jgi:hypothetical protein